MQTLAICFRRTLFPDSIQCTEGLQVNEQEDTLTLVMLWEQEKAFTVVGETIDKIFSAVCAK
jgi:hypothetical protein